MIFTREDLRRFMFGWLGIESDYETWCASPGGQWSLGPNTFSHIEAGLKALFPDAEFLA